MSYHTNPATGEVGRCSAKAGKCPFASVRDHHDLAEDARIAYERAQNGSFPDTSGIGVSTHEQLALAGGTYLGKLTLGSGRGSLADALDFDRVLAKSSSGEFYDSHRVGAPDTSYIEDINKTGLGGGWVLMTSGMTGQHSYSGPWLHSSEQISGYVATQIAEGNPGYYVAVAGTAPDDDEDEDFDSYGNLGWAIAYKPFEPVADDPTYGGFLPSAHERAPF